MLEDFLQLRVQVNQVSLCKELRHRNAEGSTDSFQSSHRRGGVAPENIGDGGLRQTALQCQTVFGPASLIHKLFDSLTSIHKHISHIVLIHSILLSN